MVAIWRHEDNYDATCKTRRQDGESNNVDRRISIITAALTVTCIHETVRVEIGICDLALGRKWCNEIIALTSQNFSSSISSPSWSFIPGIL
jgi:hypothetical protein